jgi:hypothetical protein
MSTVPLYRTFRHRYLAPAGDCNHLPSVFAPGWAACRLPLPTRSRVFSRPSANRRHELRRFHPELIEPAEYDDPSARIAHCQHLSDFWVTRHLTVACTPGTTCSRLRYCSLGSLLDSRSHSVLSSASGWVVSLICAPSRLQNIAVRYADLADRSLLAQPSSARRGAVILSPLDASVLSE